MLGAMGVFGDDGARLRRSIPHEWLTFANSYLQLRHARRSSFARQESGPRLHVRHQHAGGAATSSSSVIYVVVLRRSTSSLFVALAEAHGAEAAADGEAAEDADAPVGRCGAREPRVRLRPPDGDGGDA